ncbi:polysaccharide deacetylase family protein [Schlesneria paludicola]|uniref:polysaccharide deacetylase family protein n=1 Tax=Schlesneria paludicola TaxID=360056 RepID=UPI00029A9905|nr:polysaccharide deacetylase family protein [Schlesneria paludicola]
MKWLLHRRWLIIGALVLGWGGSQYIWSAFVAANAQYLIVTADDAGLCPAVNDATIKALEFGLVSSATIMVVCPGFDEFAEYAVAHPEHDYGVHLVLTSENPDFRWGPILGAAVPSLVRMDGSFWRRSQEVAQHAVAEEVGRELEAQVRRALDRGIRVSHLDHHMWVMLQRPDLLDVFVKLGLEFQIPLRIHRDFVAEECGAALQKAEEYKRLIQPLVDRGDRLVDFIESNNYNVSPKNKERYYVNALRKLPTGVSEFVIHCAVNHPGGFLPSALDRREADFRVFTSEGMRNEIKRLDVQIISWKELAELRKKGKI